MAPTCSRSWQNSSYSRWQARARSWKMRPSRSFRSGVMKRSSLARVWRRIQWSGTAVALALLTARK